MRRLLYVGVMIVCFAASGYSRAHVQGIVERGGKQITVSGITSVTKSVQTYPGALVTVLQADGSTSATIYSTATGTSLGNPLTSNSDASYGFYLDNSIFYLRFSGTGITSPWTVGPFIASDPSDVYNVLGFGAVCNASTNDTVAIAAASAAAVTAGGTLYIPPSTGGCKIGTATLSAPIKSDGGSLLLTTGQTTTITNSLTVPPQIFFRNATAGQGTVSLTGNAVVCEVYAEYWGGAPSASAATNGAAINAASDALETMSAGTILLAGSGTYSSDPIILGSNSSGVFTGISLRGTNGLVGSKISCPGAGDCITITNGRFNVISDIKIIKSGSKGTSRGIVVTGPSGSGADSFWVRIQNFTVSGFHINIENGNSGSADSDLLFLEHGALISGDIGIKFRGANSTQVNVVDVSVDSNATYGVYCTGASPTILNWNGGAFGRNAIGFFDDGSNTIFDISGIRDEWNGTDLTYQFMQNTSSFSTIHVSHYSLAAAAIGTPTYPLISNNGGVVEIDHCSFISTSLHFIPFGPSVAGAQVGGNTTLYIHDNDVNENVALFSTSSNLTGMVYIFENNIKFTDGGNYNGKFPNETGVINNDGVGGRSVASKFTPSSTQTSIQHELNFLTRMLATNVVAPSTPPAGFTELYVDSTTKTLKAKNDAGVISTTVIADTGSSNNFLTAISAGGVISKAQPAFSDLSGAIAVNQLYTVGESLLSSTASVNMNTATATTLFTCPSGKTCVVTRVVISNASASLTTASWCYGWESATFTNVINTATHSELTGATLYTVLVPKIGATLGTSTGTFRTLNTILQGGAATTRMDVFGYIY